MVRAFTALLLFLASLPSILAQTTNTAPAGTNAAPSTNSTIAPLNLQATVVNPSPNGVTIHWYGHGFIYLTSSVGVRVAINPFGTQNVQYAFPLHLAADFVLVTDETEDHAASDALFGNPPIYSSVSAIGLNRANGIPFHGIALQRDKSGASVANTAFTLNLDGVKFCYLGSVHQPLLETEKEELEQCDVLFLPVGVTELNVPDLNKMAAELEAKVIIPINYKTPLSGTLNLRSLDDYLAETKMPIKKIDSVEIVLGAKDLPSTPTLYLLKSPVNPAAQPAQ